VKLFRKSPLKNITLQKHVKEELGHELNLLFDVRKYKMEFDGANVERFLKLKNAIKKTLIGLNMPSMWSDGIDSNTGVLESLLDVF
jgi:predicted aspartyl protease